MNLEVRDAIDSTASVNLLKAAEPHAVDGSTAEEMADGCALLDLVEEGEIVGAMAVGIDGDHATIHACVSRGAAAFQSLSVTEELLRRAGLRSVGVVTRRTGLIRRLIKQGYRVTECHLAKEL